VKKNLIVCISVLIKKVMSLKFLINSLKNRIGMSNASEIPSTAQKEGQCDGEEKMCELDVFKRENAEMIE
jgi:hypothetical protein